MKRNILFLLAACCLIFSLSAFSQKYKSASDTIKLNKEWMEVSNDIAKLTAELTIAQNNLTGYVAKSAEANSDAHKTAQQSSDQADKATNGNLGDAKKANKKARRAMHDAEDASDARKNIKKQEKKIDKLTAQLQKKQKTLQKLDDNRMSIRMMDQQM
jgi:uncharacterized low-complexity protein